MGISRKRSPTARSISNDVDPAPMMMAAPSHTTFRSTVDGQRLGDFGAAGEVLGQVVAVGHETAKVDDALDARVLRGVRRRWRRRRCRRRDIRVARCRAPGSRRRRPGPATPKALARRLRIGGVEHHRRDVVDPAEVTESLRVAAGHDHLVPVAEQGGDESRADVAGRPGDECAHGFHRRYVPARMLFHRSAVDVTQVLVDLRVEADCGDLVGAQLAPDLARARRPPTTAAG